MTNSFLIISTLLYDGVQMNHMDDKKGHVSIEKTDIPGSEYFNIGTAQSPRLYLVHNRWFVIVIIQ